MPKPTDIELSVNLSAADTKKSADELKKTIEDVFNKSAGGALDSKLKGLQQQMSATAGKAKAIVDQMQKLEQQKVPTAEFVKAQAEFDKALNASRSYQAKVTDKIFDLKKRMEELSHVQLPTQKYQELQEYIDKTDAKLEKLGNTSVKLQQAPQTAKTVAKLQAIEEEADRLQSHIAQAVDRMNELKETGQAFKLGTDTEEYQALQTELDGIYAKGQEFANSLQAADNNMMALVNTGKDFTIGSDTEQYAKLSNDLADVNNKSRVLVERWNEQILKEEQLNNINTKVTDSTQNIAHSIAQTTKNTNKAVPAMQKLDKATKNCAKSMKSVSGHSGLFNLNLKKMTWTFIKAMIGVRGLYMLFRKLREAIVDGVKNVVLWEGESGRLNKSLSSISSSFATLKNSIGAAIVPLINALAPAIVKIIDLLTVAVNKVNMFIAALAGQKTFLVADKVQKNFAADLSDTAKNAKKAKDALKGYLSPLDEINKYQSKEDDKDTGAGGAETGTFTEMPVDNKILDWLDKLKKKFKDVLDSLKFLKDAFMEGFMKGIGNWQVPLEMIIDGVKRIGKALKDIWTDPAVQDAAHRYAESFAEMVGAIVGTALRIGLNIGANLAQGIANALEEKTKEIQDYLVEMFDLGTSMNKQIEEFALAIGEISDVLIGENAIKATTGFVNIFLESFMYITENAARLGNAIVKLVTQPIIDNKDLIKDTLDNMFGQLAEFFDNVQQMIKDVRDIAKDVWEQNLNPMFDNLTQTLSDLVGMILNFWNTYISPVIDHINKAVKELWDDYVKPVADDFMHVIGLIGELISMFIKNVWKPLFEEYFIKVWGPRIRTAFNFVVDTVKLFVQYITTYMGTVMSIIRAVLDFIKTGFTQGWKTAWENLKNDFINIWESIKNKLKGIVNTIVDILNTVIRGAADAVNGVIDILNGLSFDIPDWVPRIGGNHFGVNISHIHAPEIPHLAQGAVIPPNKEFLAMLGDQNQGTNIETPLDTMIQAFKQALGDMGNTGGGIQTLNLVLPNKKLVAQYAVEGGRVIQTSTGRNPFDLL